MRELFISEPLGEHRQRYLVVDIKPTSLRLYRTHDLAIATEVLNSWRIDYYDEPGTLRTIRDWAEAVTVNWRRQEIRFYEEPAT